MTRKEIYQFIKDNDYGSSIYELYGRSYATLSTEKLEVFVENRQKYGSQLTAEEVSEVMTEKIPMDLRVKSVYIPIIGLYNGVRMLDTALKGLKGIGGQTAKKYSRRLRELMQEYDQILYRTMKPDLHRIVMDIVDKFSERYLVVKHISLMRFSLLNEALKRGYEQNEETNASVELLLCSVFIKFALTLDRRFSELLNEKCGVMVQYETAEDGKAIEIVNNIDEILKCLKMDVLESPNIKLCEDILFNELEGMDVWSVLS